MSGSGRGKKARAKYCFKTPWESDDIAKDCMKCAEEHRQLAEWLKELKAVYELLDESGDGEEIFIGWLREKMKGDVL